MMFGGDEGGDDEAGADQFAQMALRMGPTAALVLQADSKELKVIDALMYIVDVNY